MLFFLTFYRYCNYIFNRLLVKLGNDGFNLALFGTKVADSKEFYKIFNTFNQKSIMLKSKFKTLCQNFTHNQNLIDKLWQEIAEAHSQPSRYYHTLKHLEHIYKELPELDTVTAFAIFYHDIIYDVVERDNEEKSALLCEERLALLGVGSQTIIEVSQLINETKTHIPSSERHALFLDADLAILGSEKKGYQNYAKQVRAEYAIYDEEHYQLGRKKVLEYFLAKERIYFSDYFYEKYETKARKNLKMELTFINPYSKIY